MTASAQPLGNDDAPVQRLGDAWQTTVGGLNLLKVKGSVYEMARQHGALLADAVAAGPVPYYRSYTEKILGRTHLGGLSPLLWPLVQRAVGARIARTMPAFGMEMIRGLADGAGLPFKETLSGCVMADSLTWLASRSMQLRAPGPAMHHRLALGLGCTSALAWGDATRDGKLLHGRNFDYHGVEVWPRTAAVVFHEPDKGHRYVSITAAGIVGGGITAMNDAGLTLSVHQHLFTDRARMGGTPIGLVGDRVMREASTLEEAEAILGQHRPIGCWTYVIADGNSREVLCWEENPDRHAAQRIGGARTHFGYANIYLDPELGESEVNLYGAFWRHNQGRHSRANQLLAQGAGEWDAQGIAGILGDSGAGHCRLRDSIGMVMTVGSVVFSPEDGRFWVGTGEAPTSQGTWLPFDLQREAYAPELGALQTGDAQPAAAREAFDALRRAYIAYVDEFNLAISREEMERACALQPKQALYHVLVGLLALSMATPADAEAAFSRALDLGHVDPERLAAFHLWRGRARDLQGQRPQARRDYHAALGCYGDPQVHAAAKRGLRHAYRLGNPERLHIDFAFADVISP